jgi:hypothetical protein
MKKKLLPTTLVALFAVCCSVALAAGSTPLSEHARGTFLNDPFGDTVYFEGTIGAGNTPVARDSFSGVLQIDRENSRPTRACPGVREPWTAEVTLGSGDNALVKNERGVICVTTTDPSQQTLTFSGTYTVDGADSTGIYRGAGGTGTVTYTVTRASETEQPTISGYFTSYESGNVTLRKGGTSAPTTR